MTLHVNFFAIIIIIIIKVVLGGMAKNVYQGIFQNYTGFTVYGVLFYFFMHDRVLTTFSTD